MQKNGPTVLTAAEPAGRPGRADHPPAHRAAAAAAPWRGLGAAGPLRRLLAAALVLGGVAQAGEARSARAETALAPPMVEATVTRVSDGDTLWVRPRSGDGTRPRPIKLRLLGIDAPERCQPGGEAATAVLTLRLMGQVVHYQPVARDSYQRTLARLEHQGQDIAAWLVAQGHAWSDAYRRQDAADAHGPYVAQEQQARRARRGVFAEAGAMLPSQFRRLHGPCP